MTKGLIFDMDGTLTMTEHLHHRAFEQVFRKFDIIFTLAEETREYAGRGSKFTFIDVFKRNNKELTPEILEQCIAEKRDLYKKIVQSEEIPVIDGVRDFVKRVHEKGLKKIIATGNSDLDAVRFILGRVSLLEYFPQIISISEVGKGKPAPDVFIEAAHRLNEPPVDCLIFEDAINGVLAAKAAGIRCIALETTTDRESLMSSGASLVVKNYYQITDSILYGE